MLTHSDAYSLAHFVRDEVAPNDDVATKRKGFLALCQVHQAIDQSIFGKLQNARTAKSAWYIFAKTYQGDVKVQNTKLMIRKFELLEMKEIEIGKSYFSRIANLISEIEANRETASDKVLVEKSSQYHVSKVL